MNEQKFCDMSELYDLFHYSLPSTYVSRFYFHGHWLWEWGWHLLTLMVIAVPSAWALVHTSDLNVPTNGITALCVVFNTVCAWHRCVWGGRPLELRCSLLLMKTYGVCCLLSLQEPTDQLGLTGKPKRTL